MLRRVVGRVLVGALLAGTVLEASVWSLEPAPAEAAQSSAIEAIRLAYAGRFSDAGTYAQRAGDDAAIKLVELLYLRDHGTSAGYQRIMDFLQGAPKWPLTETLQKRAEQALYANHASPDTVLAHFAKKAPLSPEGMFALARAKYESGDNAGGKAALKSAWANPAVESGLESAALKEFGSELSASDHRVRTWRLIMDQQSNAALRNARRAGGETLQAARVAQMLLRGASSGEKMYGGLPSAMREQPALKYALANYYRKRENWSKARSVLLSVSGDMIDPAAMWTERGIVVRHSIGVTRKGSAKAAYAIAKNHGFKDGPQAVEGEFLAGWIALRYLGDAETGLGHFRRLSAIAPTRTEKARAKYWIGRSLAALGDKASAISAYRDAAQYSTVYYGQLAREQIGLGKTPERIAPGDASAAARAAVAQDEVIRAFQMTAAAGKKDQLGIFLWAIANRFESEDEMNAAASVVARAGGATLALKLAKAAAQQNVDIDDWSYPVRAMPNWQRIGKPVERAFVYGLARQESEFNPQAGSRVGAQGLMQLMPGTARLVAKQYRVAYAPAKLKGDPAYNVKLGAAHLADLVDDNGGSYVLTLVGYNAGPRRAREWIAEYGDLRTGQVDPIDWVESIPFQETRQYVQKVLQNTHVYRSRLAPKTVRPLSADLGRGQADSLTVASTDSAAEDCAGKSVAALIGNCE